MMVTNKITTWSMASLVMILLNTCCDTGMYHISHIQILVMRLSKIWSQWRRCTFQWRSHHTYCRLCIIYVIIRSRLLVLKNGSSSWINEPTYGWCSLSVMGVSSLFGVSSTYSMASAILLTVTIRIEQVNLVWVLVSALVLAVVMIHLWVSPSKDWTTALTIFSNHFNLFKLLNKWAERERTFIIWAW